MACTQAVEAKEGVAIQAENQTMASITFQNYFRLYKKLSGMTGTADTEAYTNSGNLWSGKPWWCRPTSPASARTSWIASTRPPGKYDAAISDIRECYERMASPCWSAMTFDRNPEIIDQLLTRKTAPSGAQRQAA